LVSFAGGLAHVSVAATHGGIRDHHCSDRCIFGSKKIISTGSQRRAIPFPQELATELVMPAAARGRTRRACSLRLSAVSVFPSLVHSSNISWCI